MDFALTAGQEELRALARAFAYDDVRPTARELERHADPAACYPLELIRRADALGLRTLKIPRRFGGLEADCLTEVIVLEELCTGDTGFGMTLQHAWREGYALACLTTDEQRERFLPRFLEVPTSMTSLAMSEPECGSDTSAGYAADLAAGPRTTVRAEGDEWVLNGQKRWITNGVNASVFVVVARTDRAVPWPQGISVFLVPSDAPGVFATKVEDKIGLRTNMNSEVLFEDARIPRDNLLGEFNGGRDFLHRMGVGSKVKTAAKSLGIARAAYEEALRLVSGLDGDVDQRTDDALARMAMEIEATRALMWRAAWAVDHDPDDAPELERMAFTKASEVCMFAATTTLGLHGPAGLVRGTQAEKLVRDAVVMLHAGGGNHAIRARIGAALRAAVPAGTTTGDDAAAFAPPL